MFEGGFAECRHIGQQISAHFDGGPTNRVYKYVNLLSDFKYNKDSFINIVASDI